MSRKLITTLAILLALQVLLAIALIMPSKKDFSAGESGLLMDIQAEAVDRIEILGPDDQAVSLSKGEQGWAIEDYFDSLADAQKVQDLLSDLAQLESRWPVATTEESAKRFEVSEENFQRQVILKQGDSVLAHLYLGSSPGLRQVHARLSGESDVQLVDYAVFGVPASAGEWLDPGLLNLDSSELTALEGEGWRLEKEEEAWVVAGLSPQEQTKVTAVELLIAKVNALQAQEVLGTNEDEKWNFAQEAKVFSVELADGSTRRYALIQPEEGMAVLKSDHDSRYFRLPAYQVNELLSATRESLSGPIEADVEETVDALMAPLNAQ